MRNKRTKRILTDMIINVIFIMALTIIGVSMSTQGSTKESVNKQVTTLSEQMLENK